MPDVINKLTQENVDILINGAKSVEELYDVLMDLVNLDGADEFIDYAELPHYYDDEPTIPTIFVSASWKCNNILSIIILFRKTSVFPFTAPYAYLPGYYWKNLITI